MKIRFVLPLVVLLASVVACTPDPVSPTPTPTEATKERTIIYAIDTAESRQTLGTEAQWDSLLDSFCQYAVEGASVTFYNRGSQIPHSKIKSLSKEVTTFSTTDREEIKDWMKRMESEGKTVNITFDQGTGTWNGTAYASAPTPQSNNRCYTGVITVEDIYDLMEPRIPFPALALKVGQDTTFILYEDGFPVLFLPEDPVYTPGDTLSLCGTVTIGMSPENETFLALELSLTPTASIIGTWHYVCLSATNVNHHDYLLSTSIYVPETFGNSLSYTFLEDGTAILNRHHPADGSILSTEEGTWSIDEEGNICCDLLDAGGGCWMINWLSAGTMILSRSSFSAEEGDVYYQMEFLSEN